MTTRKNGTAPQVVEHPEAAKQNESDKSNHNPIQYLFPESLPPAVSASRSTPPIVSGQCAQVLNVIRRHQPILSLTTIHSSMSFRGVERRNVASYSLGTPEWPAPGFNAGA